MPTATYEPIATNTLGTATASVTFSSIPAGYTDLVIVANGPTVNQASISLRFNNDTASNYSITRLLGSGSAAASDRDPNQTGIGLGVSTSTSAGINQIINIFNYANATTYKTVISRWNNSASYVAAIVGLWRKAPEAITSITLFTSDNFAVGSTFSLYGIKSA